MGISEMWGWRGLLVLGACLCLAASANNVALSSKQLIPGMVVQLNAEVPQGEAPVWAVLDVVDAHNGFIGLNLHVPDSPIDELNELDAAHIPMELKLWATDVTEHTVVLRSKAGGKYCAHTATEGIVCRITRWEEAPQFLVHCLSGCTAKARKVNMANAAAKIAMLNAQEAVRQASTQADAANVARMEATEAMMTAKESAEERKQMGSEGSENMFQHAKGMLHRAPMPRRTPASQFASAPQEEVQGAEGNDLDEAVLF